MHVRFMFEFSSLRRGLSVSLFVLLGFVTTAFAEDDWYQIEVVIFDQSGGPGSDNRQLGLQLGYPDNWRQLTDPDAAPNPWLDDHDEAEQSLAPGQVSDADDLAAEEQPYTVLPSSERRLNGEARSLERSSGYRVLYHQAWRQPLENRAGSAWILVRGGEPYGDHHELEGALRIYLQRALFAQARLWHARFRPVHSDWGSADERPAEPLTLPAWPARFGGETPLFERLARESSQSQKESLWGDPGTERTARDRQLEEPVATGSRHTVHRLAALEQTQRLELGTTLYLDHPELGVLVHVTRYQRDADETDESVEPADGGDNL